MSASIQRRRVRLDATVLVHPGERVAIEVERQGAFFRVARVTIAERVGHLVTVDDVRAGQWSLAEATDGAGPWSGTLFGPRHPSDGARPPLDAPPAAKAQIVVTNTSSESVEVDATFHVEVGPFPAAPSN